MNNKYFFRNSLIILIAVLPVIYLAYVYNSLPATVPTHFGLDGKANGYSAKSDLWFWVILINLISIGVYFLIKNLPKIDPKKTAKLSTSAFHKIGFGVVIFMSALSILIIYSGQSDQNNFIKLFYPLMGLFFIYVGNLMHSIKPNYFVGIRVPWALEDPSNWQATHQLGGKLWVAGGLAITILTLLLSQKAAGIVFIIITALLVIIPISYSYLYFQKRKSHS
ncbi:MAG TPA: SdpI family protein [Hanamia sp.]